MCSIMERRGSFRPSRRPRWGARLSVQKRFDLASDQLGFIGLTEKQAPLRQLLCGHVLIPGGDDNFDRRPPGPHVVSQPHAVHRTRHVDIREDELYVGIGFEYPYGLISVV